MFLIILCTVAYGWVLQYKQVCLSESLQTSLARAAHDLPISAYCNIHGAPVCDRNGPAGKLQRRHLEIPSPGSASWDKILTSPQTFNTLLVDINHRAPSAANASTSLVRYAFAAVVVAFLEDMFHSMGIGWAFTLVAGFIVVAVALLALEYCRGLSWRQAVASKSCSS